MTIYPSDLPIHPPALTTGKPVWNVTLSSQRVNLQHDTARPCYGQLTAVKTRHPLASITLPYHGRSCPPIEVTRFSEDLHWQVTSFQLVAGSSSIFAMGKRSTFSWLLRKKNSHRGFNHIESNKTNQWLDKVFLSYGPHYWTSILRHRWFQIMTSGAKLLPVCRQRRQLQWTLVCLRHNHV